MITRSRGTNFVALSKQLRKNRRVLLKHAKKVEITVGDTGARLNKSHKKSKVKACFPSTTADSENSMPNIALLPTAPFTKADPAGWFRQLEAVFTLGNVTDDELRYIHLQARIDPTILREVSEFFNKPPETGKYEALKTKITAKFSESRDEQILQLLEGLTLGDRKPSDLLAELLKLAGNDVSEAVLRPMFLKKLPGIGEILAGSTEPLPTLGKLADRISTFRNATVTHQPTIAAYSTAPSVTNLEDDLQRMKSMFTALTEAITKLSNRLTNLEATGLQRQHSPRRGRPRSPSGNRLQNRDNSTQRSSVPTGVALCYYHYTFGTKARKCSKLDDGTPCQMENSGNLNG